MAASNQGDGVLGQVDYVQRLETRGGVAPAGACDPAKDVTVAVPYRARYVFDGLTSTGAGRSPDVGQDPDLSQPHK